MKKKEKRKKHRLIWFMIMVVLLGIGTALYQEVQKTVVCLDAGHGGKDVGSVSANGKRYEKDDTLALVWQVKKELEKQDIKVVLTRTDDTFVTLEERCRIANWRRADLFVSIHRNSSKNGDGVEVWVNQKSDVMSEKLANDILKELESTNIQSNRGVKTGTSEQKGNDYFVNKNTKMPSCIIELGFISNTKDNELLDKNQEDYAKAIARAIFQNVNQKEKENGKNKK